MTINNIRATDYEHRDGVLVLTFVETTLEDITGMDAALLTVQTDDGDLVEVLAGFTLRSVTYDPVNGIFRAELSQMAKDTTAAALSKLAGDLAEAEGKVTALEEANTTLAGQLAELTGAIERGLTV